MEDELLEEKLLFEWVSTFPKPYCDEMTELYKEMSERKTLEAKIYKAIDATEAVISHNESNLSTWTENEFRLNLVYGEDKTAFSDYLSELRRLIKKETEEKILKENK